MKKSDQGLISSNEKGLSFVLVRYMPANHMVEHFGALQGESKEVMVNDIEAIQQAGKMGKIVIVKAWPNFTWLDKEMMDKPFEELEKLSREQITFPLAAFLAAAGEYAYLCYTWGYRENMGTFSWYPEFDKPLGKPKGDAVRNGGPIPGNLSMRMCGSISKKNKERSHGDNLPSWV
jgi:hypothetical protein